MTFGGKYPRNLDRGPLMLVHAHCPDNSGREIICLSHSSVGLDFLKRKIFVSFTDGNNAPLKLGETSRNIHYLPPGSKLGSTLSLQHCLSQVNILWDSKAKCCVRIEVFCVGVLFETPILSGRDVRVFLEWKFFLCLLFGVESSTHFTFILFD